MSKKEQTVIGWAEWIAFPQLKLPLIKVKVDTGALTSSLHAYDIEPFTKRRQPWVRFKVHPLARSNDVEIQCAAPLVDRRMVTSSNGKAQKRYVIETLLKANGISRSIELTLADRDKMAFRMLLGRQAIRKFDFLVDPSHQSLLGNLTRADARTKYLKQK